MQDIYWLICLAWLCLALHRIQKVKGIVSYNVGDYGLALAEGMVLVMIQERFEKEIASAGWVCRPIWGMLLKLFALRWTGPFRIFTKRVFSFGWRCLFWNAGTYSSSWQHGMCQLDDHSYPSGNRVEAECIIRSIVRMTGIDWEITGEPNLVFSVSASIMQPWPVPPLSIVSHLC